MTTPRLIPRATPRGLTPATFPTRRYDRDFSWVYGPKGTQPDDPWGFPGLIPVYWDDLPLNGGDDPDTGLCTVVELVDGWTDSPPLNGNDAARAVADGSAWGPKTLGARVVTITGVVMGPRDQLGLMRDQLAQRAVARDPAPLAITDSGVGRTLTADVRADTGAFNHTWLCPTAFRYQVALTAADPLLYEDTWQTATLVTSLPGGTGRSYQRSYSWGYASPTLPNSTLMTNDGIVAAPVYALYTGDFSQSQLTDESGGIILLDVLQPAMQVVVDTSTLTAQADGLSRANYVLPGSVPMTLPPGQQVRWHLYATGAGSITLAWRSTWA